MNCICILVFFFFFFLFVMGFSSSTSGAAAFLHITPYAALHVALVQFRFGYLDRCLHAIHECAHLAQQQRDGLCLLHALTLLCRVAVVKVCQCVWCVFRVR